MGHRQLGSVGGNDQIELTHELHFPHSSGCSSAFHTSREFRATQVEYKRWGWPPMAQTNLRETHPREFSTESQDVFSGWIALFRTLAAGIANESKKFHSFSAHRREPLTTPIRETGDGPGSFQSGQYPKSMMLRCARPSTAEMAVKNTCLGWRRALKPVATGVVFRKAPSTISGFQPAAGGRRRGTLASPSSFGIRCRKFTHCRHAQFSKWITYGTTL